MTRRRLDAELVRRRLVTSREQAQEFIAQGRVTVGGVVAAKAATQVDVSAALEVQAGDESSYVSRGAHKLVGALDAFGINVRGRKALDAGASTGGFTQVLLERGAAQVIAVDVGYGQLAWSGALAGCGCGDGTHQRPTSHALGPALRAGFGCCGLVVHLPHCGAAGAD